MKRENGAGRPSLLPSLPPSFLWSPLGLPSSRGSTCFGPCGLLPPAGLWASGGEQNSDSEEEEAVSMDENLHRTPWLSRVSFLAPSALPPQAFALSPKCGGVPSTLRPSSVRCRLAVAPFPLVRRRPSPCRRSVAGFLPLCVLLRSVRPFSLLASRVPLALAGHASISFTAPLCTLMWASRCTSGARLAARAASGRPNVRTELERPLFGPIVRLLLGKSSIVRRAHWFPSRSFQTPFQETR